MVLGNFMVFKDEILKEKIYGTIIEGMKVFVLPKKGFRRKYAEITVRFGSNDVAFIPHQTEEPVSVPFGIAHFLEHKMFEKTWGDAFPAFAELGASANAYTGNNYTSYLFWTLEKFPQALRLLGNVVFSPHFTKDSVEKEKGIITQEIRMYRDRPSSRLFNELLLSLFLKHPVRYDIAGTEDSIRQITKEQLYFCHTNFYCAPNSSLYLAGDFDPVEGLDLAFEMIEKANLKPSNLPRRIRPQEPVNVGGDIRINMPVPTPLIQTGWKDDNLKDGKEMILREISVAMLLELMFGRSSNFFTKVHQEGIADRISFSYDAWPDYGFARVATESIAPDRLSDAIFKEIDRVKAQGIKVGDFERTKRALLGRFITLFNSIDTVGQIQMHLYNLGENIFSYGSMLETIKLDDVMSGLDCLNRDRSVVAIVSNGDAK